MSDRSHLYALATSAGIGAWDRGSTGRSKNADASGSGKHVVILNKNRMLFCPVPVDFRIVPEDVGSRTRAGRIIVYCARKIWEWKVALYGQSLRAEVLSRNFVVEERRT